MSAPSLRRAVIACLLLAAGCAASAPMPRVEDESRTVGVAAYYSSKFHGRRTASGVRYDERELTAAHRTLPFGTRIRVTHLDNGASVILTVTDRGPFAKGRILDVSRRAAEVLGFLREGTARVEVAVLGP